VFTNAISELFNLGNKFGTGQLLEVLVHVLLAKKCSKQVCL
jgi:hypothetical protein